MNAGKSTAPIFIMSSERSGSNLLRALISNHSNIAGPVAAQFLPEFHVRVSYYNPLTERANAYHLMEDMLSIVNHPYYAWDLQVDLDELYKKYRPFQFLDFFNLFYREKQSRDGSKRFVCKENRVFDFAFQILSYYEHAQFIYLYRDPRDYAASFMRIPNGPKTAYTATDHWVREQEKCEVLIQAFHLPVHKVKYEALIIDTPKVMEGLLDFLGEPIEKNCFNTEPQRSSELSWNVAWKNLSKPVLKSNAGKYRAQFSQNDICIIESMAKDHMIRLGYEFDTQADWRKSRFFRYRNAIQNQFNRTMMRRSQPETHERQVSRNALIAEITKKRRAEWVKQFTSS